MNMHANPCTHAITWNQVLDEIKRAPEPISNKRLAELLEANRSDVSQLTRMMANAGEIERREAVKGSQYSYVFFIKGGNDGIRY